MAKRKSGYVKSTRLSWADVDRPIVLAVAKICDGHTIFKPEAFTNAGAPPAIIAQHTTAYESNLSNHKETIFVDGEPVTQCLGVYGLDVIEQICDDLGIQYESKMGRGFQAAACYEAIRKHFGLTEVTHA